MLESVPPPIMSPSTNGMRAAGIVLAAGAGRRMGRNKMLLPIGEESLVHRAVRIALEGGLDPVVVVTGHEAERVRAEVSDLPSETVFNPAFDGPTSTSLHLALGHLTPEIEAAIILLNNIIFTTPEMIRTLLEAAAITDAPIVASRYGAVHAPPLLFRRALFPELLAWSGEGCGKAIVRRHLNEVLFLERPPEALTDVDTPEEFEKLRAILEGPSASTSRSPGWP